MHSCSGHRYTRCPRSLQSSETLCTLHRGFQLDWLRVCVEPYAVPTLCAPPLDAAAHSRSELMVISRPMMTSTGTTIAARLTGAGGEVASRMSAVDTMSLSATGSRKAPNSVLMLSCRRRE